MEITHTITLYASTCGFPVKTRLRCGNDYQECRDECQDWKEMSISTSEGQAAIDRAFDKCMADCQST